MLHQIVLEHLETFRAEAARRSDGDGLPAFVEREFREFLTCGVLPNGFARFRCAGCGLDRFLPLSCKGRGFCPSCGGRRMTERAAICSQTVLARVERRLGRQLARRGLLDPDDVGDPPPESPVLTGIAAASVLGLVAIGPRAGDRLRRGGGQHDAGAIPLGPCHARWDGWDLHAGLVIPPGDRELFDRVCRYTLRPPVAEERVSSTTDGHVRLTLRRRWTDGTTCLLFDPVDFLARFAALTPRPRVNLILYHGVLAPRAAWRRLVVPTREPSAPCDAHAREAGDEPAPGEPPPRDDRYLWAALMQRSFGFDVLACPRCGGCACSR
jgi:putative transposase/transposase-like zinc-binding protein